MKEVMDSIDISRDIIICMFVLLPRSLCIYTNTKVVFLHLLYSQFFISYGLFHYIILIEEEYCPLFYTRKKKSNYLLDKCHNLKIIMRHYYLTFYSSHIQRIEL